MFMKHYKSIISLVIAIILLIFVSTAIIRTFKTVSDGNQQLVSPSGTHVSQSDKTIDTVTSQSDMTPVTSINDTSINDTTATTAAEIRFIKNFRYSIVVYLKTQSVAVYTVNSDGNTVMEKCFTCSSGDPSSPTPTGDFTLIGKHRWRSLTGGVFGQYCSRIHGHILFHSTPFLKENPSTLDDEEYDKLGTPVSHGCIRMSVADCKWLYDNTPLGTPVSIVDEAGPSGSRPLRRKPDSAYSGWDPTDKWSRGNPYFK